MSRLNKIMTAVTLAVTLNLVFAPHVAAQVQKSPFRPFKGALTASDTGKGSNPLVLSVDAGLAFCNGVQVLSAATQLTLTGSALNFVFVDPTTCVPNFNTTGFPSGSMPIAIVTTGVLSAGLPVPGNPSAQVNDIISIQDVRTDWLTTGLSGAAFAKSFSTGAITPVASGAAVGVNTQTFTVTGLNSGDQVFLIKYPTPTALCPLVSARATAANTLSLDWAVLTAAACTPAAGTYVFFVVR